MEKINKIITSSDIKGLISKKHKDDVVVHECKNGSSWYSGSLGILDTWVMKRSWKNACFIGYEIKISRGDFIKDKKWMNYLDYCNEFYFVCPWGLIQPNELPPEIGLLWCSKNIKMLYIKKVSSFRKIIVPQELFMYILMCRSNVYDHELYINGTTEPKKPKTDYTYWKKWAGEKKLDFEFGCHVSKSIRKITNDKIDKVASDNDDLNDRIKKYTRIEEMLTEIGFDDIESWHWEEKFRAKIEEISSGIPNGLEKYLDNVIENVSNIKKEILKHTVS